MKQTDKTMHVKGGFYLDDFVKQGGGKSAILEWIRGTDATDNDGSKRELTVTCNDADSHIGAAEAASDYQVVTSFIIQPDYYKASAPGEKKPGIYLWL